MPKLLIVTALTLPALLKHLQQEGHELPEDVEPVLVDPNDPEWRLKMDEVLAEGAVGAFQGISTACPPPDMPYVDEHMEETPDRKLSAQLSPRQAILPPHLRRRRL